MKDQTLVKLAKELSDATYKCREVSIGSLPNDDIYKLVEEGRAIKKLLKYILSE